MNPEQEERISKFVKEMRLFLDKRIEEAVSEKDFAKWIEARKNRRTASDERNLSWLPEYYSYSVDEYAKYFVSDEVRKLAEKDEKLVRDMYKTLTSEDAKEYYKFLREARPSDDFVLAALRRKRDNKTREYHYRGLAIFPEGTDLYYGPESTKDNPCIVYIAPQAPCIEHACDDLFKEFRKDFIPLKYIKPTDVRSSINSPVFGALEYMDDKTKETKNAGSYVFATLSGFFSNEVPFRVPKSILEVGE